jgi:FkbM family methyltransferase
MGVKMTIASILIKMGIPILKYVKPDLHRRFRIIKHYKINLLFDIGANTGQYGKLMRTLSYKDKIVSFEPLNDAYSVLEKKSKGDKKWQINNFAMGDTNTKSVINIAGNSVSSSILDMKQKHIENAPSSKYIGTQEIEIKTLNDVFHDFYSGKEKVMLKIDTQGFEKQVLEGAKDILKHVELIQLEMSLASLYENEVMFLDMIKYLESLEFKLIGIESGFSDKESGELLQVDGIFKRNF